MKPLKTSTWVLALTAIAGFMITLDTLVVASALSTIRADLGASVTQLEWTVNAYNLSFAVLILTAAGIADRIGRRRTFAAGLAVFVVGSAGCALAPGIDELIGARVLQGVGAALVAPTALALLSSAFPPQRLGWALGVFGGITGLAVSSGPLVGGAVVDGIAWEWIFWLNVPIGLALIPFVLARVPESRGPDTALDVPGLTLVTGAAFGIVWGLVRGNGQGWGSAEVLVALAAGVVLTAAFVAWERRAAEPMLPLSFFRRRPFVIGSAAICLLFASLFGAVFVMSQFFQTVLGEDPLGTGLRLLPWTAMPMVVMPLAGGLSDRIGARPLMAAGLALQGLGLGWVAVVAEPGVAYAALLPGLAISGIGISMAIPAAQTAALGAVAPGALGKASGTASMLRELGGVLGIATIVAVFAGSGSYASPQAFSDGFGPALGASAAFALLGALVALGTPAKVGVAVAAPAPA